MSKTIDDLLVRDISRRSLLKNSVKTGVAITAVSSATLPFVSVQAEPTVTGTPGAKETVRHSACLVNCGSRCALKVIVKDDTIVRIEPEDCKNDDVLVNTRSALAYAGAPAAGGCIARIA